ncbi:DUF943 family protein [Erwinia rhapontici]|uniref:DUF943 family protein n=1 Tax=Erwinia rhapontici TaxID=55212 RepID=UPI003BA1987C
MREKSKKTIHALLFSGCIIAGYTIWLSLRPVEIFAVHKENSYSDILVKTFPLTEKGRISWWMENKSKLKLKYNIPTPNKDGSFSVIFWDFGEGYKVTDGNDRLCFEDMKTKTNCIDKDSLMMVKYSKNTGLYFRMDSGIYYFKENGQMVKRKYE